MLHSERHNEMLTIKGVLLCQSNRPGLSPQALLGRDLVQHTRIFRNNRVHQLLMRGSSINIGTFSSAAKRHGLKQFSMNRDVFLNRLNENNWRWPFFSVTKLCLTLMLAPSTNKFCFRNRFAEVTTFTKLEMLQSDKAHVQLEPDRLASGNEVEVDQPYWRITSQTTGGRTTTRQKYRIPDGATWMVVLYGNSTSKF